jgi:hypothetical protein
VLSPESVKAASELLIHQREEERIRHQSAIERLESATLKLQQQCVHFNKHTVPGFADMDDMRICDDCGKAW